MKSHEKIGLLSNMWMKKFQRVYRHLLTQIKRILWSVRCVYSQLGQQEGWCYKWWLIKNSWIQRNFYSSRWLNCFLLTLNSSNDCNEGLVLSSANIKKDRPNTITKDTQLDILILEAAFGHKHHVRHIITILIEWKSTCNEVRAAWWHLK